jgi:hypothetical protein
MPWSFSNRRAVLHGEESIPLGGEVSLKGLGACVKSV